MNEQIKSLLEWARSKVEVGAVVSLLFAVATYIGNYFYTSYFDFYFINGSDIKIPVADSIRTFVVIFFLAGLVIWMVVSSEARKKESFSRALCDNVPLFIVLFLFSGWAINIYWSNVETLSGWLSGALKDSALREQNEQLTHQVTHFLKWFLLIGPLPISLVVVLLLSFRRFSFSNFLMSLSVGGRFLILLVYVFLALDMARACGRIVGFLEFSGALDKPDIVITLSDGSRFQDGHPLYLIVKSEGVFYVAERAKSVDLKKTWQVPQSVIKHVELSPKKASSQNIMGYFQ